MPEGSSVFNEKAVRRLKNPNDVDEYIRIGSPSVYLILCGCIALLIGIVAWGIFGSVTTKVIATGTVIDGKALCFLSEGDVDKLHVGDDVAMGGTSLKVASIAKAPISRSKAAQIVTDQYLLDSVMEGSWAYVVTLEGEGASNLSQDVPIGMQITVERIAPIELLFRR